MKITKKELTNFNESSLQNILSDDEYTILPEFFKRMEEYEILESMNHTDEKTYNFKDKLTYSYFRIKSFENEQ
jgi:TusA-related sulfurtransferase